MLGINEKSLKGAHGVQSAETALEILMAFVGAEAMPMLKTIAERVGMHPAKVHRYLVSLCRTGFVEQDQMTSRYRLGPSSLRLAFAAMMSLDSIRVARPLMADFCLRLNNTVVLAVWNADRPTIAVRETLPGLLTMTATEGYVLPVIRSSIGNVFGAFLPREKVLPLIEAELAEGLPDECPQNVDEVFASFAEVRKRGMARTTGQLHVGSHSFAAPVFDAAGEIGAVLCVLGPAGQFDSEWSSPTVPVLAQCARELSARLGHIENVP